MAPISSISAPACLGRTLFRCLRIVSGVILFFGLLIAGAQGLGTLVLASPRRWGVLETAALLWIGILFSSLGYVVWKVLLFPSKAARVRPSSPEAPSGGPPFPGSDRPGPGPSPGPPGVPVLRPRGGGPPVLTAAATLEMEVAEEPCDCIGPGSDSRTERLARLGMGGRLKYP